MPQYSVTFERIIAALRRTKTGLTTAQMAERLGLSHNLSNTLRRMEQRGIISCLGNDPLTAGALKWVLADQCVESVDKEPTP